MGRVLRLLSLLIPQRLMGGTIRSCVHLSAPPRRPPPFSRQITWPGGASQRPPPILGLPPPALPGSRDCDPVRTPAQQLLARSRFCRKHARAHGSVQPKPEPPHPSSSLSGVLPEACECMQEALLRVSFLVLRPHRDPGATSGCHPEQHILLLVLRPPRPAHARSCSLRPHWDPGAR